MMRRLYYGWVVVGVGFTAWFFAGGLRDAFSVFIKPWSDYFGWGIGAISLAMSIHLLVDALLAPIGGSLADRFGPKRVLLVQMVAMAGGAVGIATMSGAWQLYLFFGLVIGMAASLGPSTTLLVAQWFHKRRGMGFSLISMGNHVGTAVLAPAVVALYALGGWRVPWVFFAVVTLLLVPVAAWLLRRKPPSSASAASGGRALTSMGTTLGQACRTSSWWMITTGSVVCGYTTRTFWIYIVPVAIEGGANTTQAALALSVAGLMNVPGLLVSGLAVDHMNRQKWLATLFTLRGISFVGLILFLRTGSLPLLFAAVALAGFSSRATGTVFQTMMVTCYGMRALGKLSGLQTMAHQIAAAAGALTGGLIYDVTGSYAGALMVTLGFLVVGVTSALRILEQKFYVAAEPVPEASA